MWGSFKKHIASYSPNDQKLIRAAFETAELCHNDKKRESGEQYITHPVAVAKTVIDLKLDAATVAAALLHDVLEDSAISRGELEKKFGKEVSFLVEALTKLDRVQYHGFARTVESTRKMFLAVAEDVRVVLIKLADRLHNMKTIRSLRPEKQKRIAKETIELFAPLAYRLGMGGLKGDLEDLSFPIVFPEEYEWLVKEVKELFPERKAYLKRVKPIVTAELERNGIKNYTIDFRAKHYYSLWKKLLKYNLDIAKITDLTAFRIIVNTIEECYQVLGLVHALWKPMPGRIKDYISLPKPNGYRSLHTTVFCIEKKMIEFQIRTREMHDEAEFGIAAHWVWEEAGKPKHGTIADPNKIAWVKKLHEWQTEFSNESGEEFLEALKIDFFKDRIFVFTPKGEVIDLPEGATPIDFAYHIHSEIGNHMSGAKVNGKLVPFSYSLASGDTVEILINKNQKPSINWLDMSRSSMARGHIRSALRKAGIETPIQAKQSKEKDKEITLLISRETRIGLLKDIASVISRAKINISKTESDSSDVNKPYLMISFKPPKKFNVEKLLSRLRKINGIKSIEVK